MNTQNIKEKTMDAYQYGTKPMLTKSSMTIEDVRAIKRSSRVSSRNETSMTVLSGDEAIALCTLAERALSMPKGLDERASRAIQEALHGMNRPIDDEFAYAVRALVTENARLLDLVNTYGNGAHFEYQRATAAEAEVLRLTALLVPKLPEGWTWAEIWPEDGAIHLHWEHELPNGEILASGLGTGPTLAAAITNVIAAAPKPVGDE